jgi:GTPase SAR1 family protein
MKHIKVPTNFNMTVVGERGSGKSTYLNDFIRSAKEFPEKEIYILCDPGSKGKFDFECELIDDKDLQDIKGSSLVIFDFNFLSAAGLDAIINGRERGLSTIVLVQNCTGKRSLNAKARAVQDTVVCIDASPSLKASISNFFPCLDFNKNIVVIDKYDESRIPKPRKSLRAPADT